MSNKAIVLLSYAAEMADCPRAWPILCPLQYRHLCAMAEDIIAGNY